MAAIYIALGCAVVGGGMTAKGVLDHRHDTAVKETWSRVAAVVTSLDTRDEEVTAQKWKTVIAIRYEYLLDSVTRKGEYERLTDESAVIRELSEGYAIGSEHQIWVNPTRPSESRLLPPEPGGAAAFAILGIVIFLGGLVWPVVEWRKRRPSKPSKWESVA